MQLTPLPPNLSTNFNAFTCATKEMCITDRMGQSNYYLPYVYTVKQCMWLLVYSATISQIQQGNLSDLIKSQ